MLITVENLKKDFVNEDVVTSVLKGISFQIEKGSFVSIMGPSGSGKSTLMHILSFLDKPTDGNYFFEEKNVKEMNDDQLAEMRSKKVGFIFQSFNLLSSLSVLENVILPLTYIDMPQEERIEKAKSLLDQVGLSHRIGYSPSKLSGGEKQRVAIARALINNPEVIFADEPTGNLDSKSGAQVMRILQELNRKGNTIILVTHETSTAEHAERIIKVKDGNIIEDSQNFCRREAKENLDK
ncbi:MAG: ABC transporter ATP-binding protein [Candidatus Pacebacteria bacterium]|nr:ABC transporter ATP-binding protein [Candidatus Paceibacterota bacterium]MDD4073935.1 ABC transporter ATP-binding protein [Candidatus Paceibacterota bacterium]